MRNASLSRALLPLLAAAALLTAAAPAAAVCPADWNGDTVFDQADVNAFATCWQLSLDADFNRDGIVDLVDYFDFQSAWHGNLCSADFDRDNQVYPDLDDLYGFIFDTWQPCTGVDIDCDADGDFDAADFALFFAAWCAAAGC